MNIKIVLPGYKKYKEMLPKSKDIIFVNSRVYETIEDIIAEGDKVWVFLTYTTTHTGEFHGIAPTGEMLTAKAVDMHRIVDGKIVEYWNVTNTLDWNIKLGVIDYTEKGKEFLKKFLPADYK